MSSRLPSRWRASRRDGERPHGVQRLRVPGRHGARPPAVDPARRRSSSSSGDRSVTRTTPFTTCFFSEKIAAGEAAGYDVVIVTNHHLGSNAGGSLTPSAMRQPGEPVAGTAAGLCAGHRFALVFGTTPDYTFYPVPAPNEPTPEDPRSRQSRLSPSSTDGDASRLLDGGSLTEIDDSVSTSSSTRTSPPGSGDLTVHESKFHGATERGGTLPPTSWRTSPGTQPDSGWPPSTTPALTRSEPSSTRAATTSGVSALARDENGDRIVLPAATGTTAPVHLPIHRSVGRSRLK